VREGISESVALAVQNGIRDAMKNVPGAVCEAVSARVQDAVDSGIREAMGNVQAVAIDAGLRAAAEGIAGAKLASATNIFGVVASLLAVRVLLLLSLLGGVTLAVLAERDGGYQAVGVLVSYAVLIVIPLIYLERNPRADRPAE